MMPWLKFVLLLCLPLELIWVVWLLHGLFVAHGCH